jgi:hypothetical protein
MANTAVVTLEENRIRSGIPFLVKLAPALDAGVSVVSVMPTAVVTGATAQNLSCRFSQVSPSDVRWQCVLDASAADDISFSIGADLKLSTGDSITATAATAWIVDSPEAGQAWFHVFEQSGLIPELML